MQIEEFIILDLSGLNCPLPVLKTKKFLATLNVGDKVKVITTDPASYVDLQTFCSKTGHILLYQAHETTNLDNLTKIITIIQKYLT